MSEIAEAPILDDGSLRSKLSARRAQIQEQHPFDLPVPGYEGLLVARYKAIDFRTLRNIGLAHNTLTNEADRELNVAADVLAAACVGLFAVGDDGDLADTGFKWDYHAARELFGIEPSDVPDGALPRTALLSMIPDTIGIVMHYAAYDEGARGVNDEASKSVEGESSAAS